MVDLAAMVAARDQRFTELESRVIELEAEVRALKRKLAGVAAIAFKRSERTRNPAVETQTLGEPAATMKARPTRPASTFLHRALYCRCKIATALCRRSRPWNGRLERGTRREDPGVWRAGLEGTAERPFLKARRTMPGNSCPSDRARALLVCPLRRRTTPCRLPRR